MKLKDFYRKTVDSNLNNNKGWADAYCGYGRDGQVSNYRDEIKKANNKVRTRDFSCRTEVINKNNYKTVAKSILMTA